MPLNYASGSLALGVRDVYAARHYVEAAPRSRAVVRFIPGAARGAAGTLVDAMEPTPESAA